MNLKEIHGEANNKLPSSPVIPFFSPFPFLRKQFKTIWVDGTLGNESNAGTESTPVLSIYKALELAGTAAARIIIKDGTYRIAGVGALQIQNRTEPLKIEAENPGQVIIKGSSVQGGVTLHDAGAGIYKFTTSFTLDLPAYDGAFPVSYPGRGRRLVWVNDELLRNVFEYVDLTPGTFQLDDVSNTVYFKPPAGVDPLAGTVEWAAHSSLFEIKNSSNIILSGITFTHSMAKGILYNAAGTDNYSFSIFGDPPDQELVNTPADRTFCENIFLDRCTFKHLNTQGIILANCKGITIRGCTIEENGAEGIGVSYTDGLLVENCSLKWNNFRAGLWGNQPGRYWAGAKVLNSRGVIVKGCDASENYAAGLWFDTGCEEIQALDCTILDNASNGFFWEQNAGSCLVKDCTIQGNGVNWLGADYWCCGVFISKADNITLDGCRIGVNRYMEIGVDPRASNVPKFFTGGFFDVTAEGVTVRNCTVVGNQTTKPIPAAPWYVGDSTFITLVGQHTYGDAALYASDFLPNYVGSGNVFYSPFSDVFSAGGGSGFTRGALAAWQTWTGSDADAVWQNPDV